MKIFNKKSFCKFRYSQSFGIFFFFFFYHVQVSLATPIVVDLILDLDPEVSQVSNKTFASISYIEFDIVHPGEIFLGLDRKAGTFDDIPYDDPWAGPWEYKWEITLLYASSLIAPGFEPGNTYSGLGYYDGGGISSWSIPGMLGFCSIEVGHGSGYYTAGNSIYLGGYGDNEAVIVSSAISEYITPIPEPSTLLLFGSSLFGLTGMYFRRQNKISDRR